MHVGLSGLRVLSANQGQCTQLTRYFDCIHFSQDNGCVHFRLPLWVLWYSGQAPRLATGYTCTKLTVLLAERRVVRRMHKGSWGRVPRYGHIRSRHIEWSTHRGAKGLVRVMINDFINKYTDDIVISVPLRIRGPPGGLSSSR